MNRCDFERIIIGVLCEIKRDPRLMKLLTKLVSNEIDKYAKTLVGATGATGPIGPTGATGATGVCTCPTQPR
ncbi:MAG: hypothetical protein LBR30_04925 [Clostridioides sp.]|jgi:hypothetical protein|nr:hypothetical protein [Clostridioides sp.]